MVGSSLSGEIGSAAEGQIGEKQAAGEEQGHEGERVPLRAPCR